MAAPKADLGALHALVTRALTEGLELDLRENIFNPALIGAATKFLKDNEITADVKSDDDLAGLRKKLMDAAAEKREAGQRILQAVGNGDMEP
jgi:hypothetical protein